MTGQQANSGSLPSKTDVVQGLFGAFLCTLPNITELYLSGSWLIDFPMFANLMIDSLL